MNNNTLKTYDVRMERGRGRITVRVLALNAKEAKAQAEWQFPDHEHVITRRSPEAAGLSARTRRREYLEGSA